VSEASLHKAGYPPEDTLGEADLAAAKWAWHHNRPAGRDSDALPPSGCSSRCGRAEVPLALSSISHDLNTPLAVVLGAAGALRDLPKSRDDDAKADLLATTIGRRATHPQAAAQRAENLPILVLSSRGDEAGKVAALD
jgi:K+-sensing histidine kinase KdpD